jgi:hypothetical protein
VYLLVRLVPMGTSMFALPVLVPITVQLALLMYAKFASREAIKT